MMRADEGGKVAGRRERDQDERILHVPELEVLCPLVGLEATGARVRGFGSDAIP